MISCNPPFKLESINIVGGDSQELLFHIFDEDSSSYMDSEHIEVHFSLLDYQNRYGTPLISRACEVSPTDNTAFIAVLQSEDTKNFADKFIYQVTVKAPNNKQKSFQGIMTIDRNIDPDAFGQS